MILLSKILLLLIVLALITFGLWVFVQANSEMVMVDLFALTLPETPIGIALVWAFIIGSVVGLVVGSVPGWWMLWSRARLRRKYNRLETELAVAKSTPRSQLIK